MLVVLLGSTITGLLADPAVDPLVWASAYCNIYVPRTITADATTAIIAAAAMIDFVENFVVFYYNMTFAESIMVREIRRSHFASINFLVQDSYRA